MEWKRGRTVWTDPAWEIIVILILGVSFLNVEGAWQKFLGPPKSLCHFSPSGRLDIPQPGLRRRRPDIGAEHFLNHDLLGNLYQ